MYNPNVYGYVFMQYAIQWRLLYYGNPNFLLFPGHTARLHFLVSLEISSAHVTECLPGTYAEVLYDTFMNGPWKPTLCSFAFLAGWIEDSCQSKRGRHELKMDYRAALLPCLLHGTAV